MQPDALYNVTDPLYTVPANRVGGIVNGIFPEVPPGYVAPLTGVNPALLAAASQFISYVVGDPDTLMYGIFTLVAPTQVTGDVRLIETEVLTFTVVV